MPSIVKHRKAICEKQNEDENGHESPIVEDNYPRIALLKTQNKGIAPKVKVIAAAQRWAFWFPSIEQISQPIPDRNVRMPRITIASVCDIFFTPLLVQIGLMDELRSYY